MTGRLWRSLRASALAAVLSRLARILWRSSCASFWCFSRTLWALSAASLSPLASAAYFLPLPYEPCGCAAGAVRGAC
jgi:hypothetical protein